MSVKLQMNRESERIELPSGSWAQIQTGEMTAGDLIGVKSNVTDVETTFALLSNRITEWGYVDENDNPLPVTEVMIKYIPAEDYKTLLEKITVSGGVSKEDTLKSSVASPTVEAPDYQ